MGDLSDKEQSTPASADRDDEMSSIDSGNTGSSDADLTRASNPQAAFSSSPAALIGQSFGRYKITEMLGRGGMGVVYRATDPKLERDVAIKVLDRALSENSDSLLRFLREARAAAKLSHPNTVPVFETGESHDTHFIVMEIAAGGSLEDHIRNGRRFDAVEATELIAQACNGLVAAHAAGLIHRDIKPGNLLLTEAGKVKLADFGLVKQVDRDTLATTQEGAILGSPRFMSPEQFEGTEIDSRSDIYSLGATYYALLAGQPPYSDADSLPQLIYAHTQKDVPDPRVHSSEIPSACASIVAKSMAKSRDDRYQTASTMLADLQNLNSVKATKVTLPSYTRRAIVALGVASALAILAWMQFGGSTTQAPQESPMPGAGAGAAPIKVGILHSLSGEMANVEIGVAEATEFALAEINSNGGLLGRSIEVVQSDGASDGSTFASEAKRLVVDEQVDAIFGCWTAAARKSVGSVVKELGSVLICPIRYAGLEQKQNVVYTGAVPNQQMFPAVDWAIVRGKKRFFLIGSDAYEFSHISNLVLREAVKRAGGELVGETYLPPGNHGSGSIIQAVIGARADVVLSTIQGDSNIGFFRALRGGDHAADDVMTISFSVNESDLTDLNLVAMTNDYSAWTYFQSLDGKPNEEFVQRFQAATTPNRIVSDPEASAYASVQAWASTVQELGTAEPEKVFNGIVRQQVSTPVGELRFDDRTRHAFRTPYIARIKEDGKCEIVWRGSKAIAPDPFPWKTEKEWNSELDGFSDVDWRVTE